MSWISDILKDVPLSAVLKEKIAIIENKNKEIELKRVVLENKNVSLKKELQIANEKIRTLEYQIWELNQIDDLDENMRQVLNCISVFSGSLDKDFIASETHIHAVQVDSILHKLKTSGFITTQLNHIGEIEYALTQKGREYCINNHLL